MKLVPGKLYQVKPNDEMLFPDGFVNPSGNKVPEGTILMFLYHRKLNVIEQDCLEEIKDYEKLTIKVNLVSVFLNLEGKKINLGLDREADLELYLEEAANNKEK